MIQRMRVYVSFVLLGMLVQVPVLAAEKMTNAPVSNVSATAYLGKSVAALLIISTLIVGVVWLMKRFGKFQSGGSGCISVIDNISLGNRERAVLLNVKGHEVLVGVAPGRVETLCVLSIDPDCPDEEAAAVAGPQTERGFGAHLQQVLKQKGLRK